VKAASPLERLRERWAAAVETEDDTSAWMLPYGALMLILLIFFAALYGFSTMSSVEYEMALVNLQEGPARDPAARQARREVVLAREIKKYIEENGLEGVANLRMSALAITLELSSPVLFESGRAELKAEAWPILEELARYQVQMPNPIVVEGFTDNVPIRGGRFRSNWELSAARAFSVIRFFIRKGIAPERLAAHGYGEFRPIADNDTEEGRARNRRVDITILRGEFRKT